METPSSRANQTALGIAIILASVVAMAFADAVVKLVSSDITLWQVFVTRSLVAVPVILLLLRIKGLSFRPKALLWTFLRSLLLLLSWLAFYASLPVLDLSVAAVVVYSNPIMTALLAALLLGEAVGWRQWAGVLLGFAGVITIMRPGGEDFSWFTLLPLLAAFFYSLAMVMTRSRCRDETPLVLALGLHLLFILAGLLAVTLLSLLALPSSQTEAYPFLLGDWAAMGTREWGFMALIGLHWLIISSAWQKPTRSSHPPSLPLSTMATSSRRRCGDLFSSRRRPI